MWSSTFLDESRDWAVTLLLPGEKSFELFGDDAVQHAFFGMMRCVLNRGCKHASTSRQVSATPQARAGRCTSRRREGTSSRMAWTQTAVLVRPARAHTAIGN